MISVSRVGQATVASSCSVNKVVLCARRVAALMVIAGLVVQVASNASRPQAVQRGFVATHVQAAAPWTATVVCATPIAANASCYLDFLRVSVVILALLPVWPTPIVASAPEGARCVKKQREFRQVSAAMPVLRCVAATLTVASALVAKPHVSKRQVLLWVLVRRRSVLPPAQLVPIVPDVVRLVDNASSHPETLQASVSVAAHAPAPAPLMLTVPNAALAPNVDSLAALALVRHDVHSFHRKAFVILGRLPSMGKDEAWKKIQESGGYVSSTPRPGSDDIVIGEKPASKLSMVKRVGKPTLTEAEFLGAIKAAETGREDGQENVDFNDALAGFRELLLEAPGQESWGKIQELLDLCAPAQLELTVDYIEQHIAQWPGGDEHPGAPLPLAFEGPPGELRTFSLRDRNFQSLLTLVG